MTVGLVLRPDSEAALTAMAEVVELLPDSTEILTEAEGYHALPEGREGKHITPVGADEFGRRVDLVVVLGGDGTLIHAAALLPTREVPIIGVNLGHIGFLTEIARSELREGIAKALRGELRQSKRMRLDAILKRGGEQVLQRRVLNDVVLGQASLSRIATIRVSYGQNLVTHIRGDGVIVSTPTGSTAYNLAAGGSIVSPELEAILVTPVCPHQLTLRPLVLSPQDHITLEVMPGSQLFMTFDGQAGRPFEPGDVLTLRRAPVDSVLLLGPWRDYFTMLRTKLNWGDG